MKELYIDTKKKIYRSTAILFVVQLFGALGAGFFFVIQNLFGTYHILGATRCGSGAHFVVYSLLGN